MVAVMLLSHGCVGTARAWVCIGLKACVWAPSIGASWRSILAKFRWVA